MNKIKIFTNYFLEDNGSGNTKEKNTSRKENVKKKDNSKKGNALRS